MATVVPAPALQPHPLADLFKYLGAALQSRNEQQRKQQISASNIGVLRSLGKDQGLTIPEGLAGATGEQLAAQLVAQAFRGMEAGKTRRHDIEGREDTQAHQLAMQDATLQQRNEQFIQKLLQAKDDTEQRRLIEERKLEQRQLEERGRQTRAQATIDAAAERQEAGHVQEWAMSRQRMPNYTEEKDKALMKAEGFDPSDKYGYDAGLDFLTNRAAARKRVLEEFAVKGGALGDVMSIFAGPEQAFLHDFVLELAKKRSIAAAKAGGRLPILTAVAEASYEIANGLVFPPKMLDTADRAKYLVDEFGLNRRLAEGYALYLYNKATSQEAVDPATVEQDPATFWETLTAPFRQ